MTRPIRKRWALVLLVVVGQSICLGLAVLWFASLVRLNMHEIVRDRVLDTSSRFAAHSAELIAEIGLTDVTPGSAGFDRLQQIIDNTTLPNDGFLCAVDDDEGLIFCYPGNLGLPQLGGMDVGVVILNVQGDRSVRVLEADGLAGWAPMADGTHLIAVQHVPDLDLFLLAHQREDAITAGIKNFTDLLRNIGLLVAGGLVILTGFVTFIIVGRYENRLAHINENLEALVEKRTRALMQSRGAVILGLAHLAESRDDETGQHLERIRRYVRILGDQLVRTRDDVDEAFVDTIVETSSLHDIGKVGIPDAVLLKPGKLTDEQRAVIQKHPLIGGDTLLAVKQQWGDDQFLVTACEIAFAHHERWDGQGYPFGLTGETIPLSARIVELADVYDALTTKRVYKPAMPHEKAARIITEGAGTHFDPALVEAFHAVEDEFRVVRDALNPPEAE